MLEVDEFVCIRETRNPSLTIESGNAQPHFTFARSVTDRVRRSAGRQSHQKQSDRTPRKSKHPTGITIDRIAPFYSLLSSFSGQAKSGYRCWSRCSGLHKEVSRIEKTP
jgi:hypothetical protein